MLLLPTRDDHRRAGAFIAILFLAFFAGITHMRARDWDSPVRFSFSEAAKHPNSPRATYDVGRTLVILGGYRPDSPFTRQAFVALEHARKVPHSGILPDHAVLMLAARTGSPLKTEWWQEMQTRLRQRPVGPQENAALASLTDCAIDKYCAFPIDDMVRTFAAALERGPQPEMLNIYGNYVLHVLDDPNLALRLWQQASELNPKEPMYATSEAKMLISLGRFDEARKQIAKLRSLGRLGQNEAAAVGLDRRLQSAIEATNKTGAEPKRN
jgi:tetratricopeptide (TPR) repeat protein